jgi:hypothetical protein
MLDVWRSGYMMASTRRSAPCISAREPVHNPSTIT